MDGFVLRPARPDDLAGVTVLCEHSFDWRGERANEWGDYIPLVFDLWLNAPDRRPTVAERQGAIIGFACLQFVSPVETWMEGLRVHHQARRLGVGLALTEEFIRQSRAAGARVTRLDCLSGNTAAHRLVEGCGFTRIAGFDFHTATSTDDGPTLTQLDSSYLGECVDFIEESMVYQTMGRVVNTDWTYHRLDAARLAGLLEQGYVLALEDGGSLQAISFMGDPEHNHREYASQYLAGTPESLHRMARGLRRRAAQRGFNALEARVPAAAAYLDAFARAGYRPTTAGGLWIFEQHLD